MRGATLLRLIFVAALSLTNSSASRSTDVLPWADRAPATVMASYMQADTWHVSGTNRLHDGIDLMRNDGPIFLTPMADGWLIRCNDTGDEDERHAVLTDGSRTYVYVHIV